MNLLELKQQVMFQTGNDADDLGDFQPHLTDYLNEGYDRLMMAYVREHIGGDGDYPELGHDKSQPELPEWLHRAIADYATWLVYRNGSAEKQSRGWDERYNCYRICEYVILRERKSGKTFTFMNTHFGFGDKGQVASAKLIYDYSRRISAHPTFVTGDFNMLPDSPGYQQMAALFTDVNAATRNDLSQTYHAYQPETRPLAHIDYCFVDSQIKPLDQKTIRTTVDGKYPSDHFGTYIELEIK